MKEILKLMKYILVNYNTDPSWVKEYTDDYLIYDRSDDKSCLKNVDESKVIHTENYGHCDYDKLMYLIDNYDNLPEVFFWGKGNLWKHITKEEFDTLKDSNQFTPVLTQMHKEIRSDGSFEYIRRHGTDKDICFYSDKMFREYNNSWYLGSYPAKYFNSYGEFAKRFFLKNPEYLEFAPGGNYILTRETVHKYGVDFYKGLAEILPYCQLPGEAQMCERSYYNIWRQ